MNRCFALGLIVVLLSLGLFSCSDDGKPNAPAAQPGRITVRVENIPDQAGNLCAIMAYDYDWQPGAEGPFVGSLSAQIDSSDFSFGGMLEGVTGTGAKINEPKVFDSGVYSVVFYVAVPDSPPSAYVEVRSTVDGDITVTAPAWASWHHSQ